MNYLIVIVLALLGRKDWLWFPLFCVVTAPTFIATIWPQARMLLRGQPVLVVDALGVSLGRERLGWDEIRVVEGPGSVRRRSADPRRPVRADLEWFDVVTVASGTERKGPRISVGKEHVGDLEGLAAWLQGVRDGQRAW
ncbi:hypothetical protein [Kribbella sp. HUAS MG21]|uniref:PH domain-containing protein n=1 Tax=Kribbella sp. HUAS MG21 TaxID=3160966 RepID=A0AAU7TBV9_9ACTN